MRWLFLLGFLLMGAFVSLYNYIGFRLLGAPFGISQSAVGLLSVLYLIGMFSAVWARPAWPIALAAATCCGW
ncbi:hypothetical protein LP419_08880 [Massilia sp. H-1]|nr:hypothetical protein LP419_08880 [Massilia sp. H-1]